MGRGKVCVWRIFKGGGNGYVEGGKGDGGGMSSAEFCTTIFLSTEKTLWHIKRHRQHHMMRRSGSGLRCRYRDIYVLLCLLMWLIVLGIGFGTGICTLPHIQMCMIECAKMTCI